MVKNKKLFGILFFEFYFSKLSFLSKAFNFQSSVSGQSLEASFELDSFWIDRLTCEVFLNFKFAEIELIPILEFIENEFNLLCSCNFSFFEEKKKL